MIELSDEEILRRAGIIRQRRLEQARLDSFGKGRGLMIRWDVPGAPFGESCTGVDVAPDDVREVVEKILNGRIAKLTF